MDNEMESGGIWGLKERKVAEVVQLQGVWNPNPLYSLCTPPPLPPPPFLHPCPLLLRFRCWGGWEAYTLNLGVGAFGAHGMQKDQQVQAPGPGPYKNIKFLWLYKDEEGD